MKIHLQHNIILDNWQWNNELDFWCRENIVISNLVPRKYVVVGAVGKEKYGVVFGSGLQYLETLFDKLYNNNNNNKKHNGRSISAKSYDEAKENIDKFLLKSINLIAFI